MYQTLNRENLTWRLYYSVPSEKCFSILLCPCIFFLDQQNLLFKKKTVMDCPKRVLNLLKLNTEQPTAHAELLAARGKNGRHGPVPAEWEHAHVILKVL